MSITPTVVPHHRREPLCGGDTSNRLRGAGNSTVGSQRPGLGAERLPGRWILREPLPALWESILVLPHKGSLRWCGTTVGVILKIDSTVRGARRIQRPGERSHQAPGAGSYGSRCRHCGSLFEYYPHSGAAPSQGTFVGVILKIDSHSAGNGSRRIQRPGLGAERLPGRWILREPLPALWESILSPPHSGAAPSQGTSVGVILKIDSSSTATAPVVRRPTNPAPSPGRWILREPLPALWESILSITPTKVPCDGAAPLWG